MAQEFIDLPVVANAVRMALSFGGLTDYSPTRIAQRIFNNGLCCEFLKPESIGGMTYS